MNIYPTRVLWTTLNCLKLFQPVQLQVLLVLRVFLASPVDDDLYLKLVWTKLNQSSVTADYRLTITSSHPWDCPPGVSWTRSARLCQICRDSVKQSVSPFRSTTAMPINITNVLGKLSDCSIKYKHVIYFITYIILPLIWFFNPNL